MTPDLAVGPMPTELARVHQLVILAETKTGPQPARGKPLLGDIAISQSVLSVMMISFPNIVCFGQTRSTLL